MPKQQRTAIVIMRFYNHATGEDFQVEANDTMLYKCLAVIEQIHRIYDASYPGGIQIMDFHQGYSYPGEQKRRPRQIEPQPAADDTATGDNQDERS